MIRVTFDSQESRDKFAERFQLENKVGDTQLDMDWHLIQFAKVDNNCLTYDDLESNTELEFVVKGDPALFGSIATVVEDLGQGFYLVKTTEGTILGDFVDSIEHNATSAKLMENVSDVTSLNGEVSTLDPSSADAQWHRLRVVSRYRPLATGFGIHDLKYVSKPEVYVMDSGINFNHPEFDYPNFESENFYTCYPGTFDDDVGHGTAVTSLIAGKNLGVSSYVKICNVKIGNSQGTTSLYNLGKALDAILERASKDPLKTRIVNMSWGTARSAWLDSKVEALQDAGVTVICAAGNSGVSVEDISPAGINSVITVASSDKFDIPSGFNDISPSDSGLTTGAGLSLDIFAPGENVMVAAYKTNEYKISSGTSLACPIVAGIAATIASVKSNVVPYDELKNLILDAGTKDALLFTDDRFSENQNVLAYLPVADSNYNAKAQELSSYLGTFDDEGNNIVANMIDTVNTTGWRSLMPDLPITYELKFLNLEDEKIYKPFINLDSVTAMLTITKPSVTFPESVKLKMIEFNVIATNGQITGESGVVFFIDTNPLYKDTIKGDITLALTETNSISFYSFWYTAIK